MDIMDEGVGGIFDSYKNFSPDPGGNIRLKVHSSSAVIKHLAFIIPTGSVVFEHDRCFVVKPRSVSLVRFGFHLISSPGFGRKSV